MSKFYVYSLLFVSLIVSSSAFARGDRPVDAVGICMEMDYSFDYEADDCIKQIRNAEYLQTGAVQICKSLTFGHEKTDCLKQITNKQYSQSEIQFCENKTFGYEVANCLKENGQAYSGEISDSEKLETARFIAEKLNRELNNGQILRAIATLGDLLWVLQ